MSNSINECSHAADEQTEEAVVKVEKYVDLFKSILDTNNPKAAINHIYFDEENMVATDTRIMLVYKHGLDIKTPFIAVNPKVKAVELMLKNEKDAGTIGMLKDTWRKVTHKEKGLTLFYPDYKRIEVKDITKYKNQPAVPLSVLRTIKDEEDGLSALYSLGYNSRIIFDYVAFSPFMKKLKKIEFDEIHFTDQNHPVKLKKEDLYVIIMPIVFEGRS